MKIVFTDLDGTLLDHETYSFQPAKQALHFLRKNNIPVVFCTSKTRAEILYWRKKIGNNHPFISENGGGIFIPQAYFSFSFDYTEKINGFFLIRLGALFSTLKQVMNDLEERFDLTSFLQFSVHDLMKDAHLSRVEAENALNRDFDIPFIIHDKNEENDIINEIKNNGLHVLKGGRFYHLMGENDKGKAVGILTDLFTQKYGDVKTIGIGDSENDFSMLETVDQPYIVKKKDGTFETSAFNNIDGIGPVGWQKTMDKEFQI